MEIIPSVYKIDGVIGANCYLVTSGTDMVLIDTGMRGSSQKVERYLKGLGKNLSEIKYIFITHADLDHVGGAAKMKKLTGAKLVIHAGDALVLAGRSEGRTLKGLIALVKYLAPIMHARPVEADIVLKENTDIAGFKVLCTPGHSEGSISIYLPGKVIFVGDALRSDAKGNLKPPSKALAADMVQAKASVTLIAGLEYDTLLCGHGAPVKGEASAKVKNLLANWK
jgi:glyoxylase-like metal-dependent hydrolase (beta-lactamase superfamily II)